MLSIQGYILTSEIDGTIQMKSYLSGNPEIRLALNDDLVIGRGQGQVFGICFLHFGGFVLPTLSLPLQLNFCAFDLK